MILTNIREKVKHFPDLPRDIFLGAALLLSLSGAFMLGRISRLEEHRKSELRITTPDQVVSVTPETQQKELLGAVAATSPVIAPISVAGEGKGRGTYVGSKTGKIYHLPWCSGAKRIKEENKIWFSSKTEAEQSGYAPAGNCKGI